MSDADRTRETLTVESDVHHVRRIRSQALALAARYNVESLEPKDRTIGAYMHLTVHYLDQIEKMLTNRLNRLNGEPENPMTNLTPTPQVVALDAATINTLADAIAEAILRKQDERTAKQKAEIEAAFDKVQDDIMQSLRRLGTKE